MTQFCWAGTSKVWLPYGSAPATGMQLQGPAWQASTGAAPPVPPAPAVPAAPPRPPPLPPPSAALPPVPPMALPLELFAPLAAAPPVGMLPPAVTEPALPASAELPPFG